MIVIMMIANTYRCYYEPGTSLSIYCLHMLAHLILMATLSRRYKVS